MVASVMIALMTIWVLGVLGVRGVLGILHRVLTAQGILTAPLHALCTLYTMACCPMPWHGMSCCLTRHALDFDRTLGWLSRTVAKPWSCVKLRPKWIHQPQNRGILCLHPLGHTPLGSFFFAQPPEYRTPCARRADVPPGRHYFGTSPSRISFGWPYLGTNGEFQVQWGLISRTVLKGQKFFFFFR